MDNREPERSNNVFVNAIREAELKKEGITDEEIYGISEEPAGEPEYEEEPMDGQEAVPAQEPDTVGKAALGVGKILSKILKPVKKVLYTFFAPVIKPFKKGADRITRKDWVLFIGLILIVALIVAAPVVVMRIKSTCTVTEAMYSPYAGVTVYWDEGGTFRCDDDDEVWFTPVDGDAVNATGMMFYYQDSQALFWPVNGLWYSVDDSYCYKVQRFSEVSRVDDYACLVTAGNGTAAETGGYIYDNKDTYVFLETVTVEYNDETVTLPPLSSVTVKDGISIAVYVYGYELIYEELTTDATAWFSNNARVDMSGDQMFYANGSMRLIYRTLEGLSLLGE